MSRKAIVEHLRAVADRRNDIELVEIIEEFDLSMFEIDRSGVYQKDFIIIKCVTYIEVFVRICVKMIVDEDSRVLVNLKNGVENTKIDLKTIGSLGAEKLTIGDIVGHSISVNSIDNIEDVLFTLLPPLKELITKVSDVWGAASGEDLILSPIIKDYSNLRSNIDRLFFCRHIVTHELPTNSPYKYEDVPSFVDNTFRFMLAVSVAVAQILGWRPGRRRNGMSSDAADSVRWAEEKLAAAVKGMKPQSEAEMYLFEKAQRNWRLFIESEARWKVAHLGPGSLHNMLFNYIMAERIMERAKVLADK